MHYGVLTHLCNPLSSIKCHLCSVKNNNISLIRKSALESCCQLFPTCEPQWVQGLRKLLKALFSYLSSAVETTGARFINGWWQHSLASSWTRIPNMGQGQGLCYSDELVAVLVLYTPPTVTIFSIHMKHHQLHQKYFAACHIFNSLLSVSSSDEIPCLMLGILLQ